MRGLLPTRALLCYRRENRGGISATKNILPLVLALSSFKGLSMLPPMIRPPKRWQYRFAAKSVVLRRFFAGGFGESFDGVQLPQAPIVLYL